MTSSSFDVLKSKWTAAGQGQVFKFWETLSADQQHSLLNQLSLVDVDRANKIFKTATTSATSETAAEPAAALDPLPKDAFDDLADSSPEDINKWHDAGLAAIANNEVAVILLAGGQGTRLGSSDPKGMYDIGLPSHKSLFQYQAERILGLQRVATDYKKTKMVASGLVNLDEEVVIPWYIMTSGPTRAATESFFIKNSYFGCHPTQIFFFNQGVLPAFTPQGKIFLETTSSLATAPDGNGGIYAALRTGGVLADLEKRGGVKYIHAYCVDNCLVKVASPTFVGYCVLKGADCGAKVVPKSAWNESVGVICLKNSKFSVVEYSEISQEVAQATHPTTGKLLYSAANIANHFYTVDFLRGVEQWEDQLEYHIAKKKIKHVDLENGQLVSPTANNGIKLELFIFDVFPFTKHMAVLQVPRATDFSPLKNAPGSKDGDSPDTSRADILKLHAGYLKAAGVTIVRGSSDTADVPVVEISPLVSYAGEGLASLKGKALTTPILIDSKETLDKLSA